MPDDLSHSFHTTLARALSRQVLGNQVLSDLFGMVGDAATALQDWTIDRLQDAYQTLLDNEDDLRALYNELQDAVNAAIAAGKPA